MEIYPGMLDGERKLATNIFRYENSEGGHFTYEELGIAF